MSQIKKNCLLSNGLCVLSMKKKTNDLVLLALTDFNNVGKVIFDLSKNKVAYPDVDLKLKAEDFNHIQKYVTDYAAVPPKTVEVKVDSNEE